MESIFVSPAYGRKYSDEVSAREAWESGADFKLMNGPYCSIRDFDKCLDRVVLIQSGMRSIVVQYGVF